MPLELNSLLHNRYRILEKLGSGGMGAVFRGHDENLGVEVAIKENLAVSPEAERQFRREAKILASLQHPHLPRVTDYFILPDQGQYLVMDYVEGEDAQQLVKKRGGPLPEEDVLRWAAEITSALDYMHARKPPVIHRDIKPGNLKIDPSGKATLVDFGLAKEYDPIKSTTLGARALTPGYAPPEQYGHGRTDARTDIFSLGATLYTLLTGQAPADGLRRAMGQDELKPIRFLNPNVSNTTAEAVEKALNTTPDDRFENVEAFARALEQSGKTKEASPAPTVIQPAPPEPTNLHQPAEVATPAPGEVQRRNLPLALIGLGGLVVIAAVIVTLFITGVIQIPASPSPPQALASETSTAPLAAGDGPTTDTPPVPASPTSPPAFASPSPTMETSPTPDATPIGGGAGKIAFVSERAGRPQIFLMNVDGSDQVQLTSIPDGACQPAWSPNGDRLLFVSPCTRKDSRYLNGALYVMEADGDNPQLLISFMGGVYDPDWSTKGIAFTYYTSNRPSLWLASSDGSETEELSMSNAHDRQASWAPDGERIAYMNTSRTGSETIFWMFDDGSFDGPNPDQITREVKAEVPDWSPNGDLVAYVANLHIHVIKWDAKGYNSTKLTVKAPNDDPDWSPDGSWIVFESWHDAANHDIYRMTLNGGMLTRLTDDTAWDYQPAWKP